jgi:cysteine desulfurase
MDPACYFDNAATTPVDPRVFAAMEPYLKANFGNANSIHAWGREACAAVTKAREQVARLIQADDPSEVVFTSGATEANNWVLRAFRSIAISPFEHGSVSAFACSHGATVLENDGWTLRPTDAELTSVMRVNNETGAVLEMPSAKKTHSDATQAVGKVPFDAKRYDFVSMSAHKFYGPKGVGALYIKGAAEVEPLLFGGEQEHGRRSGTLNVPGIVGMGAAAAVALERLEEDQAHARALRTYVKGRLSEVEGVSFVEHSENSPFVLSACFSGLEGESLVVSLDAKGYAASSGSACSSGKGHVSGVLKSLGLPESQARGAVRVSFGRFNTVRAAEGLCDALVGAALSLKKLYV